MSLLSCHSSGALHAVRHALYLNLRFRGSRFERLGLKFSFGDPKPISQKTRRTKP